ncbi:MAG: cupin domain-containing protein [Xanthomonadaceae bacterium]|nr:cupin domain-containing protein [Xanthomonadaceae bacterium]MDE1963976.1 cupin domain-containing protein [Xanthomonadaceae bacterium]
MHPRAARLIERLALAPHVEGGHFRRFHAAAARPGSRPPLSAIHFLLAAGEQSAWHRVDAEEAWHFVEGDPLELLVYHATGDRLERIRLEPYGACEEGIGPVHVVPAGAWQAARPLGDYALCTCVVAPAFEFAGFTLLEDPALTARLAALAPQIRRRGQ